MINISNKTKIGISALVKIFIFKKKLQREGNHISFEGALYHTPSKKAFSKDISHAAKKKILLYLYRLYLIYMLKHFSEVTKH